MRCQAQLYLRHGDAANPLGRKTTDSWRLSGVIIRTCSKAMPPHLRPATPADGPFLRQMTYEAIQWRGDRPPIDEVMARPELGMIIANWGRPGDSGLVALDEDGEPIGAAWYRTFPAHHHAYGFVDESIPEVAIAIRSDKREQGLGTALLRALLERARVSGFAQLSLSVEQANERARHVYTKLGFRIVRTNVQDCVMVIDL